MSLNEVREQPDVGYLHGRFGGLTVEVGDAAFSPEHYCSSFQGVPAGQGLIAERPAGLSLKRLSVSGCAYRKDRDTSALRVWRSVRQLLP